MLKVVSEHQLKVYDFAKGRGRWLTAAQIADGTRVNPRTARHLATAFVEMGIFESLDVFPAHLYRFKEGGCRSPYVGQIDRAREAFAMMDA